MAVYNKYQYFVEDIGAGKHAFPPTGADAVNLALTNTTPNAATHRVLADITEIANGNGYTSGSHALANVAWGQTGGTASLSADDYVFTATGGAIAQFEFVVLYNATETGGPLIGWWQYPGGKVDLQDNETFTVDFGATVLTLT